jgi:ammonia channel protein AmtB
VGLVLFCHILVSIKRITAIDCRPRKRRDGPAVLYLRRNFFVYVPLARWIFYPQGWLAQLGVLDFAGGLVVEMASGVSAFVLAFWLGPGETLHGGHHGPQPHSLPLVLLGAGLLLFGWFGFNAGRCVHGDGWGAGRGAGEQAR